MNIYAHTMATSVVVVFEWGEERLLKTERESRRMKLLNQGMIVRVPRCDNFESSQLDITTHVRC